MNGTIQVRAGQPQPHREHNNKPIFRYFWQKLANLLIAIATHNLPLPQDDEPEPDTSSSESTVFSPVFLQLSTGT